MVSFLCEQDAFAASSWDKICGAFLDPDCPGTCLRVFRYNKLMTFFPLFLSRRRVLKAGTFKLRNFSENFRIFLSLEHPVFPSGYPSKFFKARSSLTSVNSEFPQIYPGKFFCEKFLKISV